MVVCLLSTLVLKESKPNVIPQQSAASASNQETFCERFFISRLIITAIGVTTILTYVNVSPMLVMGELGFDRGGYSSVMAGTALVSMLTSFLRHWLCLILNNVH